MAASATQRNATSAGAHGGSERGRDETRRDERDATQEVGKSSADEE